MNIDQVVALVSGIAGALAAILTALIPLVALKYRKPLKQAQTAVSGINAVAIQAAAHYQAHLQQYNIAKKDGKTTPETLALMAADVAASLAEMIATIQTTVDNVQAVK